MGLARGYLNRPELTAERFIQLAVNGEHFTNYRLPTTVYRTGDRCRFLADGNIAFLGRLDQQVKVRGFRIELGEIEAVLKQHEHVRETAVLAQEDSQAQKQLVAYLVIEGEPVPTTNELHDFLAQRLPKYMIPAVYVLLETMPHLPNGKVDRNVLPALDGAHLEQAKPYAPPRNPSEEIVAGIWAHFLQVEPIGIYDDFHELGGHSLLATQIISRVRRIFQIDLPLRTLFENPTVASLALAVQEASVTVKSDADIPLEPIARHDTMPLSYAQQRIWFLEQLEPGNLFYNIPAAVHLMGKLDKTALQQSVNEIVRRHGALRTVFTAEGGTPQQQILPELVLPVPLENLQNLPLADREAEGQTTHWGGSATAV